MSNGAARPNVDAVPALEAKASLDLQAARETHARSSKAVTRPRSYYWNDPLHTLDVSRKPSVHVYEAPSASAHSRTPSNSFTSWKTTETALTGATTPQQLATMSPPNPPASSFTPQAERPSHLDISALSPHEYAAFGQWVERIKPAHSRRRGLLDEHAAVKFLRNEFGISVDQEVKIMSLFERLPLGLTHGHFYAMLRLASWAQQGFSITKELVFVQTSPPEPRRRRQPPTRNASAATDRTARSVRRSPMLLPQPMMMDVPKAPPRQVPDDDVQPPNRDAVEGDLVEEPEGLDDLSASPSSPRVVRPKPVVARAPHPDEARPGSTLPPLPGEEIAGGRQPSRSSLKAPDSPSMGLMRPSFDRPPAPLLPQQVSPLIQASLNARSEMKKASRQASRPKTFTVLSSSSGQVERDKPRLLTGQEAPPQAQPLSSSKRRTHSINKMSSFLAQEARQTGIDVNDNASDRFSVHSNTIAPKPSYVGREHGILPAWLREQQEEGNVSYAPPDEQRSTPSVFEALDEKVNESMNGSERAAASINRNTPFFPPHKRDLDRVAQANMDGSGPAHYRALNAQTSAGNRASSEIDGRMKLSTSRSKGALNGKALPAPPRRRMDAAWGTLFEAGTYAGFKSMPSARDLRLLTPRKEPTTRRSMQYPVPPSQEFQPMLAPTPDAGALGTSLESVGDAPGEPEGPPPPVRRDSDPNVRSEAWVPRMQAPPPRTSELQRFVLQGDATRPQLPHPIAHDRKASGSYGTGFKTWPKPDDDDKDKGEASAKPEAKSDTHPEPSAEPSAESAPVPPSPEPVS